MQSERRKPREELFKRNLQCNYAISRSKIKFQKFAVGKKKPGEELFNRKLQCKSLYSVSKTKFQKFAVGKKKPREELFKRNLQCNYAISRSKISENFRNSICNVSRRKESRKEKTTRGIIQTESAMHLRYIP